MTYDKIQFIGYAIDTGPKNEAGGGKTYLGLPDPVNDIDARCKLMRRAMETARDQVAASPPADDVLKVFMAPEFFFRGNTGAYQLDDVQYAVSSLQELAADDQWKDWLFIFGTVVGTWQDDNNPKDLAINYALIQEGGSAASGPTGTRIVTKELMSGIDFIAGQANPDGILLGQVEHLQAGPYGPGRETQKLSYDGAGIFTLHGITWACEICLDHLVGRLLQSPQLPGENQIQVQLVPSGGASIKESKVIAETDGFVFNVDGLNGSSADLQRYDPPLTPIASQSNVDVDDSDIDLDGISPPQVIPVSDLYRYGAGKVVIYGDVDVPPQTTVPGTTVPLSWDTDQGFKLDFDLVYDVAGDFTTALCRITCPELPNDNNRYFVPMNMNAKDENGENVSVKISLDAGAEGFDASCYCNINSDRFNFSGIAFLFDTEPTDPPRPPKVSW